MWWKLYIRTVFIYSLYFQQHTVLYIFLSIWTHVYTYFLIIKNALHIMLKVKVFLKTFFTS